MPERRPGPRTDAPPAVVTGAPDPQEISKQIRGLARDFDVRTDRLRHEAGFDQSRLPFGVTLQNMTQGHLSRIAAALETTVTQEKTVGASTQTITIPTTGDKITLFLLQVVMLKVIG